MANELVVDMNPEVIVNEPVNAFTENNYDRGADVQKNLNDSEHKNPNRMGMQIPLVETHMNKDCAILSNEEVTNSDSDDSESDSDESESGFESDENDTEDVTNPDVPFTKDDRIMFSESGLTVSDVLLMLQGLNIKFNTTRRMQNALLDFVRNLAGPAFQTWTYSPYLMSKTVAPPAESIKKNYYCSECNVLLGESLLHTRTKTFSLQCEKCEKVYSITSQSSNYFVSLDVKLQIENLLNRKDIQKSMLDQAEKEKNKDSAMTDITDITDSELYKKNIIDEDILSFNFSTDGAQLQKSTKKALWPLQLHLNCLTGRKRFKYPVIVALWQTEKEPTPAFMDLFMSVFKKQCDELRLTGVK